MKKSIFLPVLYIPVHDFNHRVNPIKKFTSLSGKIDLAIFDQEREELLKEDVVEITR